MRAGRKRPTRYPSSAPWSRCQRSSEVLACLSGLCSPQTPMLQMTGADGSGFHTKLHWLVLIPPCSHHMFDQRCVSFPPQSMRRAAMSSFKRYGAWRPLTAPSGGPAATATASSGASSSRYSSTSCSTATTTNATGAQRCLRHARLRKSFVLPQRHVAAQGRNALHRMTTVKLHKKALP